MDSYILDFLEAYKSLDEMCKQILSTKYGVSAYIEEMESNSQGSRLCAILVMCIFVIGIL